MNLIRNSIAALALVLVFCHRLLELLARPSHLSYFLAVDAVLSVSQEVIVILSRPLTVDSFNIILLDINLRFYAIEVLLLLAFITLRNCKEIVVVVLLLGWTLLLILMLLLVLPDLVLQS